MECAADAIELGREVGRTGVICREGLLALDWLFFSNEDSLGGFAYVCELVCWDAQWARRKLLQDANLAKAKRSVDLLYGNRSTYVFDFGEIEQKSLFAA